MKPKNPEAIFKEKRESIDRMYQAKLAGPLRFGDTDQIKILNLWERDIELLEEEERARNDPTAPLLSWRVRYSYRVDNDEYVEARTAEEAEELVREDYDYKDDFGIDYVEAVQARKRA